MHVSSHTYTYTFLCACNDTYTQIHRLMLPHTCIHAYVCVHIHAHTKQPHMHKMCMCYHFKQSVCLIKHDVLDHWKRKIHFHDHMQQTPRCRHDNVRVGVHVLKLHTHNHTEQTDTRWANSNRTCITNMNTCLYSHTCTCGHIHKYMHNRLNKHKYSNHMHTLLHTYLSTQTKFKDNATPVDPCCRLPKLL